MSIALFLLEGKRNIASLTKRNPTSDTVNVLSILKSPMILLALVSMGIFIGMPYLMDNSKSLSHALDAAHMLMRLFTRNSGPRDAQRVGGIAKERPHGHSDGRRRRRQWQWHRNPSPAEELRHGGVPGWVPGQQ